MIVFSARLIALLVGITCTILAIALFEVKIREYLAPSNFFERLTYCVLTLLWMLLLSTIVQLSILKLCTDYGG